MDFIFEGIREGFGLVFGGDQEVLEIAFFSLKVALISTLVSCLIGIPIGFLIGTSRFWGRRAVITALNTMLAFPTVVIGLWVWGALSRNGPFGGLDLLYSLTAIVVAEVSRHEDVFTHRQGVEAGVELKGPGDPEVTNRPGRKAKDFLPHEANAAGFSLKP